MKELKELYEAKEKVLDELGEQAKEVSKKDRMSTGDVDALYKLAKTHYYLCEAVDGLEGGYSEVGNWNANIRGTYGDNSSYAGRRRDSRGRYSRRGGNYSRNDGGMYSMDDGLIEELEEKMHMEKDPMVKDAIKRCISAMRG